MPIPAAMLHFWLLPPLQPQGSTGSPLSPTPEPLASRHRPWASFTIWVRSRRKRRPQWCCDRQCGLGGASCQHSILTGSEARTANHVRNGLPNVRLTRFSRRLGAQNRHSDRQFNRQFSGKNFRFFLASGAVSVPPRRARSNGRPGFLSVSPFRSRSGHVSLLGDRCGRYPRHRPCPRGHRRTQNL